MTEDLRKYAKQLGAEGLLSAADLDALSAGCRRVYALVADGGWHSAEAIRDAAGGSEGLRRLRELRGAGLEVAKRRREGSRHFEYQIRKPAPQSRGMLF